MSRTWSLIKGYYKRNGGQKYMISEPITQVQHALQSYKWMKNVTDRKELHAAAFLHDIGHLIKTKPLDPRNGIDDLHEITGSEWLAQHGFPESVCGPILQHVAAKRYLCTIYTKYYNKLTDGSKLSLALQGGKMHEKEVEAFKANPFFEDALLLREADDGAKNIGVIDLPPLDSLEDVILSVIDEKKEKLDHLNN